MSAHNKYDQNAAAFNTLPFGLDDLGGFQLSGLATRAKLQIVNQKV
jgi:hypothetical protein